MLALAAAPFMVLAVPALAQASLAMLDTLDKGGWEVRYRDGSGTKKVCVKTGRELIQLRHTDSGCNRFVVEDGSSEVTVQYTCRGNGYGRTSIRKETGALVQIDTQGIADGKPFQFSAEGRRTGACN
ncbi:hypothetical protein K3172_01165 [Qipengyuania sp. 6B39]|uniref:DUF3617 domain-containing protein n=1 Tax=Qipengyuania proteolytica TaxID=2867239 RepID=UPI001C8A136E|nr:hypothetical protein [Qipengyuania proteolytica]MBX7494460.1 hypothetical protein [Qipengyuania proteolytica]